MKDKYIFANGKELTSDVTEIPLPPDKAKEVLQFVSNALAVGQR